MEQTSTAFEQNTKAREVIVEAAGLLARSVALGVLGEVDREVARMREASYHAPAMALPTLTPPKDACPLAWLTIPEAAQVAHVDVSDIEHAIDCGDITCYQHPNGAAIVQAADINLWIITTWNTGGIVL